MLVIEPATSARFSSGKFGRSRRPLSHQGGLIVPWNKIGRSSDCLCSRWNKAVKNGIRASAEGMSSPPKPNDKPQLYHPSEDISDSESDDSREAMLKPAESSRTVIEVNRKALLMFAGAIPGLIRESLFWPDLPYVTDEHGDIYFQVKNDDILQPLTSEDDPVQVIIGLDTSEMFGEMASIHQADVGFDDAELDDEDGDVDDDSSGDEDGDDDEDDYDDDDWVGILEDEEDGKDSDGSLGDWAKLETMRSLHPLEFARQLAQFVSDDPVNYMGQPPAGVAIQGLLRPAFVEESSVINKNKFDHKPNGAEDNQINKISEDIEQDFSVINGHKHELGPSEDSKSSEGGLQKDESLINGTSYYKLEMMKMHLITAHGSQTFVELEDFRRAKPDAIAHSAAKIISRVKAGGEKTTLALKSLCLRFKGIQAEEVALIGVDSLGFELRVCSGRQVQTLRFGFNKRRRCSLDDLSLFKILIYGEKDFAFPAMPGLFDAEQDMIIPFGYIAKRKGGQIQNIEISVTFTRISYFTDDAYSEYSTERQLNCLLFPRIHGSQHERKEAHQTEQ